MPAPNSKGFAPRLGIFTIIACLVVNQLAYVLAIRLNSDLTGGSAENLPEQRAKRAARRFLRAK